MPNALFTELLRRKNMGSQDGSQASGDASLGATVPASQAGQSGAAMGAMGALGDKVGGAPESGLAGAAGSAMGMGAGAGKVGGMFGTGTSPTPELARKFLPGMGQGAGAAPSGVGGGSPAPGLAGGLLQGNDPAIMGQNVKTLMSQGMPEADAIRLALMMQGGNMTTGQGIDEAAAGRGSEKLING